MERQQSLLPEELQSSALWVRGMDAKVCNPLFCQDNGNGGRSVWWMLVIQIPERGAEGIACSHSPAWRCPAEPSVMMEMFSICAVQFGG